MHADFSASAFVRITPDAVIYRYLHKGELFQLLQGTLRLTCPFKWAAGLEGDPCENLLFQTKVISRDGIPLNTGGEGCKIYVQSWTMVEESDAMWRLYGQGESVKIRTTAGALLGLVQRRFNLNEDQFVTFKIGAVDYLDESQVAQSFATAERFREGLREPHESTMMKRRAYEHESEARLVAYDFDDRNRRPELGSTNLRAYPENPFHLDVVIGNSTGAGWIEDVVINPRLAEGPALVLADQIASKSFD
ncbi:MAG: hypothetical protein FJ399_20515 [Verrucomicrobia bacterium]|nr:hypothetical protein [Verrucomicrobiota bacterium]